MTFDRKTYLFISHPAVLVLLLPLAFAQAQTNTPGSPAVSNQRQGSATRDEKAEDVEQLKSQVKHLQLLVEQQQRALSEIQKRFDETDVKSRPSPPASSTRVDGTVSVSPD